MKIKIKVMKPSAPKAKHITEEEVWGKYNKDKTRRIDQGMVVTQSEQPCQYFKDTCPYKAVTVLCDEDQVGEVLYWLDYVQGTNSATKQKKIGDKVAIRAEYQAW